MTMLLKSLALAGLAAAMAVPASAQVYRGQHQSYSYDSHGQVYGHDRGYRAPSYADQFDRPGDFRCDAYWDRGRTDCHEGWRDQRRYSSGGYGYNHYDARRYSSYGRHSGYGYGRGYGHSGYGQGYGYAQQPAAAYYGGYGRPDLVYGGGGVGYGQGHGARDPRRIDWCRWNYRSYNPATGYYLAYSGRYVYCG